MSAKLKTAAVVGVALVMASGAKAHGHTSHAAAAAVAYARAQIGDPYAWGAEGPSAFDCSGLAMRAWQHAGVTIPRTSQQQWSGLPHVSHPRRGDLVFFPGNDGTWSAPGHVAIWIAPHKIIQAYTGGTDVMVSSYGTPGSLPGVRSGEVVGYADPGAS